MCLLCTVFDMDITLAAIYVPPPYSGDVLKRVLAFVDASPMVPIVLVGDFNNYLHLYWIEYIMNLFHGMHSPLHLQVY